MAYIAPPKDEIPNGAELTESYDLLSMRHKRRIDEQVERLTGSIKNFGRISALEVLWCLVQSDCWPSEPD
jgi:hypothetical protein